MNNEEIEATPEQFAQALDMENHVVHVPEPVRISAVEFLTRLQKSPTGLRFAFDIVAHERYNPQRVFWAFNTLLDHIPNVAPQTSPEAAMQLYDALQHWIGMAAGAKVPDAILAKHAQVCAVGVQAFFPERWPNVFQHLFQLFDRALEQSDEQMILYFVRVWSGVHHCVGDPRSEAFQAQRQRNNFVKDEMRTQCIPRAVHCWYTLLMRYAQANPNSSRYAREVPQTTMELLGHFAEWIDIDLLIADDMVQLYWGYLAQVPHARDETLEAVRSIVDKGQVPDLKLRTIQIVLPIDRCSSLIDAAGPLRADNERFLGILSRLLVTLLQELLRIQAPVAGDMGHSLIPVLLRLMQDQPLLHIRECIVPMMQEYVKLSCCTPQELKDIATALFAVACVEACPGWMSETSRSAVEEVDKILFNVFRLIYRKAPQIIVDLCGGNIQRVASLNSSSMLNAPPHTVEMSLRLLFEMGEAFRAELARHGPNHASVAPFAEMTLAVLKSDVLSHPYPPVQQLYFELLLRYHVVLQRAQDSEILVLLNACLFHDNGVQNPNSSVRDKNCYVLNQLLHHVKPRLQPHCNNVVFRLLQLLGVGRGSVRTPRGVHFSVKNRGDLFEVLGLLLAMTDHSMMRGVFEGIVHDITDALEKDPGNLAPGFSITDVTAEVIADNLSFVTSLAKGVAEGIDQNSLAPVSPQIVSSTGGGPGGMFPPIAALPPSVVNQQQQQNQQMRNQNGNSNSNGNGNGAHGGSNDNFSNNKSTSTFHQTNVRDFAAWLFEAASRGLDFPAVRERALLLLQQIINVIGCDALPFVRTVVGHTIDVAQNPSELTRTFRAFAQAVNLMRRSAAEAVGDHLLPHALTKMMSLGAPSDIFDMSKGESNRVVSESQKEMLEVYKSFFHVLHATVHTSCVHSLRRQQMANRLADLMSFILESLRAAPDSDIVKTALQILTRMYTYFAESWHDMAGKMQSFFHTDVFPATCEALTRAHVTLNDARVFIVVSELASFVREVAARTGPETLDQLMGFFCKLGLCTEQEARNFLDKVAASLNQSNNSIPPSALNDIRMSFRSLLETMGRNRNGSFGGGNNNNSNNNNSNNNNSNNNSNFSGSGMAHVGSGMGTPPGSFFEAALQSGGR